MLKEAVNSSSNDLKLKWGSNANLDRALSGLLPILEASGYVLSETKIMNDQSRSYITCRLTPRGSQWRSDYNNNRKICRTLELPVPPVVRVIEEEKRVQTDQLKAQLVADAVDLRWIPQNVLDDPEGEGKGNI